MNETARFIDDLNERYLVLHERKERAFWDTRMGLADRHQELATAEVALREFVGDPGRLARLRELRSGTEAGSGEAVVLDGWIALFSRNAVEDDEAREILRRTVDVETELQRSRTAMTLGYTDPASGEFVPATSVGLANRLRSSADEAQRRATWEGLRSIEPHVLANGFLEIVKLRNRFARRLGFEDYYDYKVSWSEGFGKQRLFELLDDLESRTREKAARELQNLARRRGAAAIEPWSFGFHTGGSLAAERDPYFRFEDAVERWVRSFAALGVSFANARITLDLLDRKGKYENGFMHGPVPAFRRRGEWLPAEINFTANAVPTQVGSGARAAQTLFHEGGHAAHFANVRMDAPCFSQEYAPTSAAMAETQSMFLDSLLDDADWQTRYARNADGNPIPFELIEKNIRLTHPFAAQRIRSMLTICYAEKTLYEMSESALTPEAVLGRLREVEERIGQLPGGAARPTLSVPHLLAWESSANYQGYVLAQMAVAQTRRHLLDTFGHLVDNPAIGPELARVYWAPGNSKSFLAFVEEMTGTPLTADALVEDLTRSDDDTVDEARRKVRKLREIPEHTGSVDLEVRLAIVHGHETVVEEGTPLLEAADAFRGWVGTWISRAGSPG